MGVEGFNKVFSAAVLTDEYGEITACWIKGFHESGNGVIHLVDHNMDGDLLDPEDVGIRTVDGVNYEYSISERDSAWSNPDSTGYADQVLEHMNQ
jgi:hypothetical protein